MYKNFSQLISESENVTVYLEEAHNSEFALLGGICAIVFCVIFPFYIVVYRTNRQRERSTPIFPIIKHIHSTVVRTYFLLFGCFVIIIISFALSSMLLILVFLIAILSAAYLVMVSKVNHLLMGILAIQRFGICFHPRSENYLKITHETLNWIVAIGYAYFVLEKVVSFWMYFCEFEDVKVFYMFSYISMHLFLLISALAYIPLILNIWKTSKHLKSAQLHKLQNHIMCQFLLIIASKFIYIPIFLFNGDWFAVNEALDGYISIFLIQASYLVCNHRNLKTFFDSIDSRNVCKLFCCPFSKGSRVGVVAQPVMRIYSTNVQ
ncbi:Serpentine Receptor, class Z [Caenorhabditis elegans]|uniref:Serpentine Receptor, class Z n=1 Tax=Caenorhabditis elegans TaxID=6239 RepID=Q86D22_CAEEL|nr:Serpentine Receptor, class Z [Caenorhabditis elegans]CAD89722.2 Serpentine Receptor, class Z [Caenorhabditis elegans]|eukprot:NP_001024030.1 Serpentine Receptor, class Z [Caenorhabditis elegans]